MNYNLILIIKRMPPYWVNKALPTPILTLPDTLFSTFWLFPLFYRKKMPFRCDMKFEKGEKKVCQKMDSNPGWSHQKAHAPYHLFYSGFYTTETDYCPASFCSIDWPDHSLVGWVSVNSLSQQGWLFVLSVNRQSINLNEIIKKIRTSSFQDWDLEKYGKKKAKYGTNISVSRFCPYFVFFFFVLEN